MYWISPCFGGGGGCGCVFGLWVPLVKKKTLCCMCVLVVSLAMNQSLDSRLISSSSGGTACLLKKNQSNAPGRRRKERMEQTGMRSTQHTTNQSNCLSRNAFEVGTKVSAAASCSPHKTDSLRPSADHLVVTVCRSDRKAIVISFRTPDTPTSSTDTPTTKIGGGDDDDKEDIMRIGSLRVDTTAAVLLLRSSSSSCLTHHLHYPSWYPHPKRLTHSWPRFSRSPLVASILPNKSGGRTTRTVGIGLETFHTTRTRTRGDQRRLVVLRTMSVSSAEPAAEPDFGRDRLGRPRALFLYDGACGV